MAALLQGLAITGPVTAQVTPAMQFRDGLPASAVLQATFTYGSGGTTVDAWVQTSFDGGSTWCDAANFHFTTASLNALYNLNANTSITTALTLTDGTLAANTSKDGVLGPLWRVKYTTTGTYAGGTTLLVAITARGRLTSLT
jgi:hypothetical protein